MQRNLTEEQLWELRKNIKKACLKELTSFDPTPTGEEGVSATMSFVADFLGSVAMVRGYNEKEFIKGVFTQCMRQINKQ